MNIEDFFFLYIYPLLTYRVKKILLAWQKAETAGDV